MVWLWFLVWKRKGNGGTHPPSLGLGWCDSEASCFHPPAPLVASCASFFLLFFSFLLYPLKTNTHTHRKKGKNPAWGGGCYTGWAQGWLCPLCHRLGGSMCWGIPPWVVCPLWVVSPMLFVPQSRPPPSASGGFLRSQTVPTPPPPLCPPDHVPSCPLPWGGPAPRDPPYPPLKPPPVPSAAAWLCPPPSSWQLGLTGPRGRCCWQPSPAHTYGGGQQLRAPPPPKTNSFPPNLLPVAPRGFF